MCPFFSFDKLFSSRTLKISVFGGSVLRTYLHRHQCHGFTYQPGLLKWCLHPQPLLWTSDTMSNCLTDISTWLSNSHQNATYLKPTYDFPSQTYSSQNVQISANSVVKIFDIILVSSLCLIFHVQSIGKSCQLYLKIDSLQPALILVCAPAPLTWSVSIAFQSIFLLPLPLHCLL